MNKWTCNLPAVVVVEEEEKKGKEVVKDNQGALSSSP